MFYPLGNLAESGAIRPFLGPSFVFPRPHLPWGRHHQQGCLNQHRRKFASQGDASWFMSLLYLFFLLLESTLIASYVFLIFQSMKFILVLKIRKRWLNMIDNPRLSQGHSRFSTAVGHFDPLVPTGPGRWPRWGQRIRSVKCWMRRRDGSYAIDGPLIWPIYRW